MEASFDGLRKNLALAYNELVEEYTQVIREADRNSASIIGGTKQLDSKFENLRSYIAVLVACYDDQEFHDLSDIVTLRSVQNV